MLFAKCKIILPMSRCTVDESRPLVTLHKVTRHDPIGAGIVVIILSQWVPVSVRIKAIYSAGEMGKHTYLLSYCRAP